MIEIALAAENDLLDILKIEQEAMSPPWTYEALFDELNRKDSFFIVANMTGDGVVSSVSSPGPIGYAILRKVGDNGELLKIAVDKSLRGNGIGDLLMTAVLDYAEENKLKPVFLEVRVGNIAATRLYEKYEFKSVRVRKDYYNDPYEDALVMIRGDLW